jgi:hypothetical protein
MRHEPPDPPRWAAWLLSRLHPDETLEEVQGDLEELYAAWLERHGRRRANVRYGLAVLSVLPPFVRRRRPQKDSYPQPTFFQPDMLRNYLLVAWRNLTRHKAYASINVFGLAAGMATALLIGLWIHDELSFNQYHGNYHRIVQLMKGTASGNQLRAGQMYLPYSLVRELETHYAGHFKHLVTATPPRDYIVSAGAVHVSRRGQYIGAGAPDLLTLRMLRGTRAGLNDPHSVLLSASTAAALFGSADPVNRSLRVNNQTDVKVTGVYEDLPHHSAFHGIKFFLPFNLFASQEHAWLKDQGWDNHFLFLYAQLRDHTTLDQVAAGIREAEMKAIAGLENMKAEAASHPLVLLHPMRDWHLYSQFEDGTAQRGPIRFVWMVGLIGAFVLLLACINFMNLSTARSSTRSKEVGIRKAIGSRRGQLVGQFLGESLLVVGLAFGLSLGLAGLFLPLLNGIAGKELVMPWTNPWFWSANLVFMLLTGLLAGSYPALYLSSFQPVKVLKGTFRVGRWAALPRKGLVVAQFTVSVGLIIGTLIVYKQIVYAKNRPVGYTRPGLLMTEMKSGDFEGKVDLLRNELKKTGVVAELAESDGPVTDIWSGNGGFSWKGKHPDFEAHFATLTVSAEYGRTVGWQFVGGRDFAPERPSDSSGFVINETAARYMGLAHPVGQTVRWTNKWYNVNKDFQILGVVKDMVMGSPFEPIKPTVFFLIGRRHWLNLRIHPAVGTARALPKIEAVFKKLVPNVPFDYQFADQEYAAKFAAEERIGQLAAFFASLAIFISCLGLFGLAAFTAEQRTREIGIRKVLGATVVNLWGLLSKDFLYLVIVAFVIAAPLAWYGLHRWLENYSYRTPLSWWVFAGAGGGALLLTLLTVSVQAVKAALQNPVKSLRTE